MVEQSRGSLASSTRTRLGATAGAANRGRVLAGGAVVGVSRTAGMRQLQVGLWPARARADEANART